MFDLEMKRHSIRIPAIIAMSLASCLCIPFILRVSAQGAPGTSPVEPLHSSQSLFSWVIAAGGFITLLIAIGYGFAKKQKYLNLETERNELKSLAESREERIKELKYTASESEAKNDLKMKNKETEITGLKESNKALVSQALQMKAILRKLRLDGIWNGHEDSIHETQS